MTLALSIIILCTVIALGKILGRCKLFGISLGVTWILFVGIVFAHYGYNLDPQLLHFVKEFGLILFVYSIGMQVGPSFFSSFRSGGVKLNLLATLLVLCGVAVTCILTKVTGTDPATMVGVMSGAVTNTPGLGAAQQAFADATGGDPSSIAQGYAVAYPLGVVGCILSFILLKNFFKKEEKPQIKLVPLPAPFLNSYPGVVAEDAVPYIDPAPKAGDVIEGEAGCNGKTLKYRIDCLG